MITIAFAAMVLFERNRLPNPLLPVLFLVLASIAMLAEGLQ